MSRLTRSSGSIVSPLPGGRLCITRSRTILALACRRSTRSPTTATCPCVISWTWAEAWVTATALPPTHRISKTCWLAGGRFGALVSHRPATEKDAATNLRDPVKPAGRSANAIAYACATSTEPPSPGGQNHEQVLLTLVH